MLIYLIILLLELPFIKDTLIKEKNKLKPGYKTDKGLIKKYIQNLQKPIRKNTKHTNKQDTNMFIEQETPIEG